MMWQNEIQESLRTQPDDGLRFECLEISCNTSGISGYRIYRNATSPKSIDFDKLPDVVKTSAISLTEKNPALFLFDYSKRSEDCYSIAFRIYKDIPYHGEAERLPNGAELVQAGCLIDSHGTILGKKEYYGYKDDESFTLQIVDEATHRLLLSLLYKPFMYGINSSKKDLEEKIYYMNAKTSLDRKKIEQSQDLLSSIHMPPELADINAMLYGNNLWLRGFAYSASQWRFYYFT